MAGIQRKVEITTGCHKALRALLLAGVFASVTGFTPLPAQAVDSFLQSSSANWQSGDSSEKRIPDWLDVSGYFESVYRQSLHRASPLAAISRLFLETNVNRGGMLRAYASAFLEADFSVWGRRNSKEDVLNFREHEAYLTLDTRHLDVIAGLQHIRWGEADSMSTFDVFNPIDYRNPISTARSSARLSTGAINLKASLSEFGMLDVIAVPVPRFSLMPKSGSPWEEKSLQTMRSYKRAGMITLHEEDRHDSPEFGARFKLYRSGYDLAFLFFRGYEHTPRYSTGMDVVHMRPLVIYGYRLYTALGISMALSAWDSTFRWELTAKRGYPFQGSRPMSWMGMTLNAPSIERRNEYQTIVGWDKTFFSTLNVNLQAFGFVHDGERINGKDRTRYGVTWSVSDKYFNEELQIGTRGEYFLNNDDGCIEIFSEYIYDDNLKFNVGFMFFTGKNENDLGQFKKNKHFYVGARYSF